VLDGYLEVAGHLEGWPACPRPPPGAGCCAAAAPPT
jgi:hypothetical protein